MFQFVAAFIVLALTVKAIQYYNNKSKMFSVVREYKATMDSVGCFAPIHRPNGDTIFACGGQSSEC